MTGPMNEAVSSQDEEVKADDLSNHITMLHRLADGVAGKLILASFGQDPMTGKDIPPRIEHFQAGQVEEMTAAARRLNQEPHRNVYAPLAVFRPDLANGKKGFERDVVAVLGLVPDFDAKDDP